VARKHMEELPPGVVRCRGANGTITFDGIWVSIDRGRGMLGGLIAPYGTGEKKVALTQITSWNWKAPTDFSSGYVSFTLSEGTRSLLGAVDENKVTVSKNWKEEFLTFKAAVEGALGQQQSGTSQAASTVDPAEHLKKLADIHKRGLITDEEFAAKRAAIVEKL
jgi:hypothetical protein